MEILVDLLVFLLGLSVVLRTLDSAVRTFVLPRGAQDILVRWVFTGTRFLFSLRLKGEKTYAVRDRILAYYAPISLLLLPGVWSALILLGYMGMYWALGVRPLPVALTLSGSSMLTLGNSQADNLLATLLTFTQALIGLALVALLISYLPTIYSAFARREAAVTLLDVRAGSPPSPIEMLSRFQRIHGLDRLHEVWLTWESWFADVEESHSSLAALVFFRSPRPEHSWVTAAGVVLDSAALATSLLDVPHDPQADLCIRAGYLTLRHIANYFNITYDPNPRPDDPISISRGEYDQLCAELGRRGLPLKPDREQTWRDFAGWRVNYDTVLLALARITTAPEAYWISDRPGLSAPPWYRRWG